MKRDELKEKKFQALQKKEKESENKEYKPEQSNE